MIRFTPTNGFRRVLCLGAHSDDIEIGCGATLMRLLDENPHFTVCWVVFAGADQRRAEEARQSARRLLADHAGQIIIHQFRDSFLPYLGAQVKECFEQIKKSFAPDLIFTHYRDDAHQDHRLLCELTWNTFRDHVILEYEIPKYDGDLGRPNLFVPLSEAFCQAKIRHILDSFPTQAEKHWFSAETFQGIMRLRGMECAAPAGYAEAFFCRKMVI